MNSGKQDKVGVNELYVVLCIFLFCSIFTGLAVFSLLTIEQKLGLAILSSCLVFLILLKLANFEKGLTLTLKGRFRFIVQMKFQLIYSLSLLAIVLIPSMDSQIMTWSTIPLSNYLRVLSALLITYLLPGFALTKICHKQNLSILEKLIFSFIVSLLISALFGANLNLLLFINFSLLIISFFPTVQSIRRDDAFPKTFTFKILEFGILFCAFLLFTSFLVSMYSGYWLFIGPDIWRHYGWALNIIKGIPEIPMVTRTFHNILAGLFQLSGFPFINTWILSSLLLFITILSFYLMASAYLGNLNKKAPIIATIIWAFFSGFGWVYATFLRFTTQLDWLEVLRLTQSRTHLDIGYTPGFWTFMGDNPPAAIGLVTLFSLLYLIRKKDYNGNLRFMLFTTTFITAYILHTIEATFFFIIIPLLAILKDRTDIKSLLLSIASACLIIISYDLLYQSLNFGTIIMTATLQSALYIFIASSSGWILSSLFVRKSSGLNFIRFPQMICKTKKYTLVLILIVTSLIYLYGLSIFAWLEIKEIYMWGYSLPYRFISWYFYPVLLGTVGLFFIAAIALSRALYNKYKNIFIFLLVSTAFFFISGRFISYVNLNYFDTRFNETRVLSFLYIPLAMLASISILYMFGKLIPIKNGYRTLLKNVKLRRWIIFCALFTIVSTSGLLSTLMTVDYWTLHSRNHPYNINSAELLAMDYLRHNTNPAIYAKDVADYNLVFTLTDVSYQTLQAFSGTGSYLPYSYKGNILFDANQLGQPLFFFDFYRTRFIYMAQRDYDQLSHMSNSFLGQYLQFLPKTFENEDATIYEIPSMSPPQLNSETAIILPTDTTYPPSYNHAMLMFAKSLYNYTAVLDSDAGLLTKNILVLPTDPFTPIPIFIDNTFTEGWEKDKEELNAISDGNILELSFDNNEDSTQWVSFEMQFPEAIDASTHRYLVWRVFIDDMVEDYENLVDYAGIRFYDDNAKSWFWVGVISLTNPDFTKIGKGSWVEIKFDAQNNRWHQFGNVSKMQITLRVSPNSTQKIKTDYVALYEDMFVIYDPNLTSQLVKWVENGGQLLVINSEGMGDFSDILKINQANISFTAKEIETITTKISIPSIKVSHYLSTEPTVEIIGNYISEENESLFALRKIIGKGEIIYIIAEPYISAMESVADEDKRIQLFNNMDSLLEIIDLPLSLYENMTTQTYEAAFREANLLGRTTLESNSVILPEETELLGLSVTSTETSAIQSNNLDQVLLSDIKTYGDVNWIMNAQNVNITNEGSGLYSKVLIGGECDVILNLCADSSVYLELQDIKSGDTISSTIDGGEIGFKICSEQLLELFVRTPQIFTNGTSNLKALCVDKILYDYSGTDVTITGQLTLSVAYSDTTIISTLKMGENTQMDMLKSGKLWDEMGDVPWINILASTEHVFLVIVILLLLPYLINLSKKPDQRHDDDILQSSSRKTS